MPRLSVKFWPLLLAALVILVLGVGAYRYWQGPVVAAYRMAVQPLVQNVVATGRVIATSRVQVGSEITGMVLERRVREGDHVEPGDVLLVLRADELEARAQEARAVLEQMVRSQRPQAEAALREAELQLDQARREAARRAALLREHAVSREAKEQADQMVVAARAALQRARLQAEALAPGRSEESILRHRLMVAEAALARTVLRAEVAGTILTRAVEPGDVVQPGRTLLEIARSGETELLVPVDEKNLSILAPGQRAQVVADAYPDQVFAASVSRIAPTVDRQRGTVDIWLTVEPVPPFLLEDMTVTINVLTAMRDAAVAVPNDALREISNNRAVVLAVRDGRIQRVAVELGLRGLAASEVLAGLRAGDWVLANGEGHVEGSRVRIREQPIPGGYASWHVDRNPVLFTQP